MYGNIQFREGNNCWFITHPVTGVEWIERHVGDAIRRIEEFLRNY